MLSLSQIAPSRYLHMEIQCILCFIFPQHTPGKALVNFCGPAYYLLLEKVSFSYLPPTVWGRYEHKCGKIQRPSMSLV